MVLITLLLLYYYYMDKKTAIIVIAVTLLLISSAHAAKIDFYGIDIEIRELAISTKMTITFDSKIDSFSLPLGKVREGFRVKDAAVNKGSIACKGTLTEGGKTILNCEIKDPPNGRNAVTLELEGLNYIETVGDKNTLLANFEFPLDTGSLSVTYRFPERATLSEDPPQNSISPRNGDIKTDGKKIFVFWDKEKISAGDIVTFSASFTLPEQRESPVNTLLIIPIIGILSAFAWFVIKSKHSTNRAGESAAVSVLSSEEKALFDILKAGGGKANQKTLVRDSGFSKAKVSRLLKDLKERSVIEIEPVSGRENRVLLLLGQPREIKKAVEKSFEKDSQEKPKQDTREETGKEKETK